MIVYALVASNVSVGALFLAGLLPGVVTGCAVMAVAVIVSGRFKDLPTADKSGEVEEIYGFWRSFFRAFPSLLMLFIVIGVIIGGIMTPTESSAIAVLWSLLLVCVFYREVKPSGLPRILINATRTTGIVLLLIGTSAAMSRLLTIEQVPQAAASALLAISESPLVILLLINFALLIVGIFMDMTPAILVFHSDLSAGCNWDWNRPGSLRSDHGRQPVHRIVYTSGRFLFVPWLRRGESENRRSVSRDDSVLHRDVRGSAPDHLL